MSSCPSSTTRPQRRSARRTTPTSPKGSASIAADGEILIRPATADDEPAVRTCAEAAYSIYIERIGRRPAPMDAPFGRQIEAGQVHVLEAAGTVAGYAVFYPCGDHLHLENIAVRPEFKGRGLGGALLRSVEEQARSSGLAAIELYTNEKMSENLTLYPRQGYAETGRRVEDGFSRVFFRKEI